MSDARLVLGQAPTDLNHISDHPLAQRTDNSRVLS